MCQKFVLNSSRQDSVSVSKRNVIDLKRCVSKTRNIYLNQMSILNRNTSIFHFFFMNLWQSCIFWAYKCFVYVFLYGTYQNNLIQVSVFLEFFGWIFIILPALSALFNIAIIIIRLTGKNLNIYWRTCLFIYMCSVYEGANFLSFIH